MALNRDKWIIRRMVVGELMVNCYLIGCGTTGDGIVIDPGGEAERILEEAKRLDLNIRLIVNTHGHGDHIGANRAVKIATKAPLLIGTGDAEMLTDPWKNLSAPIGMNCISPEADKLLNEGDLVIFGECSLRVLETPGHSPGGISLVGEGFAVVGDLLFSGGIGRTDFPGGSLDLLLSMIREKIYPLGDDCEVYSGHGPETTIGIERRTNPFLQEGFRF